MGRPFLQLSSEEMCRNPFWNFSPSKYIGFTETCKCASVSTISVNHHNERLFHISLFLLSILVRTNSTVAQILLVYL